MNLLLRCLLCSVMESTALMSSISSTFARGSFCVFVRKIHATSVVVEESGGGMHVEEGRPLIVRCSFDNNAAVDGGGLAVSWASKESGRDLVLSECDFTSNTATHSGGGVHASGMELLKLSGCTIDGGSAVHGGGIAVVSTDQLTILGSTFTDLDATDAGGGLHMQGGSTPQAGRHGRARLLWVGLVHMP